jgi:hypothetical protein
MKREVTFKTENNIIGSWHLECPTCPLRKHTDALGEKPKACASGIHTNMQGPIVINKCVHYQYDTLASDDKSKTLTLECTKEDEQ